MIAVRLTLNPLSPSLSLEAPNIYNCPNSLETYVWASQQLLTAEVGRKLKNQRWRLKHLQRKNEETLEIISSRRSILWSTKIEEITLITQKAARLWNMIVSWTTLLLFYQLCLHLPKTSLNLSQCPLLHPQLTTVCTPIWSPPLVLLVSSMRLKRSNSSNPFKNLLKRSNSSLTRTMRQKTPTDSLGSTSSNSSNKARKTSSSCSISKAGRSYLDIKAASALVPVKESSNISHSRSSRKHIWALHVQHLSRLSGGRTNFSNILSTPVLS